MRNVEAARLIALIYSVWREYGGAEEREGESRIMTPRSVHGRTRDKSKAGGDRSQGREASKKGTHAPKTRREA